MTATNGPLTALQPPDWPAPKGYANGTVGRGRVAMIGGQIGWDAEERFAEGLVAQVRQALRNILAVLAEAGGGAEHIGRMTWYVVDMDEYRTARAELGPVYREVMGRNYPAMSLVQVVALVEPQARVEIEATALLPD
jgi:enamine deaminase RidA (YjgF/YER057c/UK114 family)